MLIQTRRDFFKMGLRSVSAIGAASALGGLGSINALAAGPNYKALVCIFLYGGNDCHNTVVPIATSSQNYGVYQVPRGALAIPQGSLLPVTVNGNQTYGLHPQLGALQNLFVQSKLAILANVGMLAVPIPNKQLYTSGQVAVPTNLFSHSDQQNQWQSSIPSVLGNTGWGGRMADAMQSMNSGAQFAPVVTTGNFDLFCTGVQTLPTTVPPPNGAIGLSGANSAVRQTAEQQLLTFDNGLQLVQAANGVVSRGVSNAALINNALASGPTIQTVFPATSLAAQLKMVARIVSVSTQLGLNRQIFFCTLGGFDTHGSQLSIQDGLLAVLGPAIGAFYTATQELGVSSQVTTFTTSEFGRTLMPNSSAGTDHAWGGHHFIAGDAVLGGKMYGTFPQLILNGPDDANNRGTLIPTTSVDQYGATLANWFGVSAASMASVFPNIAKFGSSNLGFLG